MHLLHPELTAALALMLQKLHTLAVSKISRFGEQDRSDIRALSQAGYFTANQLRRRATEALDYYVGNLDYVRTSIQLICDELDD